MSCDVISEHIGELSQVVHDKISEYLNFDINESIYGIDAVVFGGAVRDSIANMTIHDVDILVLPNSQMELITRLKKLHFLTSNRTTTDINSLYHGIEIISQPITLSKDNTIIQLIKPKILSDTVNNMKAKFYLLLSQVDISACGVYYENGELFESIINSIQDCKKRCITILPQNCFYNKDRIVNRVQKLLLRGWTLNEKQTDMLGRIASGNRYR